MMSAMFAALLALTPPAEPAQASAFETDRFIRAGFPPLPEREPRAFRRLILNDPYMMLGVPSVEVSRAADGTTALAIQYPGWRSPPVQLDPEAWATLVADDAIFAPPPAPVVSDPAAADRGPPPICHAWSGSIQTDDGRTASWHGCSEESPVSAAAIRMIGLAMATRPDCERDPASPFFAFNTCFKARSELDDPALEAVFAPLRQAYDAAPGFERLRDARQAIAALGDAPDDAAWTRARDAVALVRALQASRREILQQLIQLNHGASAVSEADKARMGWTIEAWSSFIDSQDRNYIGLLEGLVSKSGRPAT